MLLLLVLLSVAPGRLYVTGLPFLRAATEQDHKVNTVTPEVDPVTWTEVDPKLGDTPTDGLAIAEVAKLHSVDPCLNACASLDALPAEPCVKGVPTVIGDVVDNF